MNKKQKLILLIVIVILFFMIFGGSKKDDNILYIKNFLDEDDYQKILSLNKDKNNFIYEKFRYSKPLSDKMVNDIFYQTRYINQIELNLDKKLYPSEFPIEHRFYPKDSPGMDWHKDLLMYQKPQYEAIFTIRNESNSLTEWKDSNNKIHKLWTEPNSILIVKAQGYEHHVTSPEIGEREILKLIYTQSDKINENYNQEMQRFKNKY